MRLVVDTNVFVSAALKENSRGAGPGQFESPIKELVHQFETVHEFVSIKANSSAVGSNLFAWSGMLLLPIGIALRAVKTSLELFVPLQ
jgi:hypothetical protein